MPNILLIQSNPTVQANILRMLSPHVCDIAPTMQACDTLLQKKRYDVVFYAIDTDVCPVAHIKNQQPSLKIIALSTNDNVDYAVSIMRSGADDYISPPITQKKIHRSLNTILNHTQSQQLLSAQSDTINIDKTFGGFIGTSTVMQGVYKTIETISSSHAPVFITGDTGTGKEIAAKTIHDYSPNKKGAFISINCSAIPEDLFESELFGHTAGAFTGANNNRTGAIRSASGGTLFLDEIAEMPLNLQVKLLSVLQTKQVTPLGSDTPIQADFRLICATNQDIHKMVHDGTLREDLFHRIYVLPIHLPPLNERGTDISLLANYFTEQYSKEEKKEPVLSISSTALVALQHHHWVGNVRQLQNIIRRAVIMATGRTITCEDLALSDTYHPLGKICDEQIIFPKGTSLANAENTIIEATLLHAGGNKTEAARILGIDVSTLRRKLSSNDNMQNH